MAPRIGVTACAHLLDYLEAVKRAGGDPVVLAPGDVEPDRAVVELDGLLLTGGRDVDPTLFGEPPHATAEEAEPGRDQFEIDLVRAAVARNLPLLGICRGMQVINVALGGTLIQDIPNQMPGAQNHDVTDAPITLAHEVWVTRESQLGRALGDRLSEDDSCEVNSRHHQAVGRLGDGVEATATSPDGVVEGLERSGTRFCVGVQWHPENFWRTGEFRPLFEAFIDACHAKR